MILNNNKIGELMPKANNKDAAMNKTYEKITKMENDYPFLLSYCENGTSISAHISNNTTTA